MLQVDFAPSLPAHACAACATSARLAAPFVRLCHASDRKWHQISDYLAQIDALGKSSFVFVDDHRIHVITDDKACKSEKQALKTLKLRSQTRKRRRKTQCDAKCPDCDKRFTNVTTFNVHLKDLRKVMCVNCKMIVPIESYVNHVRRHKVVAHMCKSCTRIFHCKNMYLKHKHSCRFKGSLVCSECKKCFPSEHNLVSHVASKHTTKVCSSCGKKFSKLCYKHHSKVCADSKPVGGVYICDYCSKEYNFKNALKLHIRFTHLIGWEYQCEQCGKKFSNPAHLREHDNTHNRVEDRYICSVCGSKYSTRRGYERHYKRHFDSEGVLTNQEPRKKRIANKLYMCLACNYTTEYKRTLEKHLKTKHNIIEWDDVEQS